MIFNRGDFDNFKDSQSQTVLNESVRRTRYFNAIKPFSGTTVFISHKHDELDLDELNGVLGMLKQYNVIPYIDSMDNKMPKQTCAETAKRIKDIIKFCDKFILFATNRAVESYWCNWEVGIGDVHKYKQHIAILPMQDEGLDYKGNEYLKLYNSIEYFNGTTTYRNSTELVKQGFYVRQPTEDDYHITPLQEWLNS